MFHYVYQITNINTNKKYIGCRSSSIEPLKDLGIIYFSSSSDKEFKKDQRENNKNYIYEILSIFNIRLDAILYESELHKKFNVDVNDLFYNKAKQNQNGIDFTGRNHTFESRNKIGNASKSRIRTIESNKKLSKSRKGIKFTEDHKKKLSEAKLGKKNQWYGKSGPMYGKKHSIDSINKMSESKTGEKNIKYWKGKQRTEDTKLKISNSKKGISLKQKIIKCPYCEKSGGNATMPRWHFNNCKFKPSDI